jgi:hypothetical protein
MFGYWLVMMESPTLIFILDPLKHYSIATEIILQKQASVGFQ